MQLSFGNFMLADKLFAKALRSLKTCVLVNNTYVKIILIIGITVTLDERFPVTSYHF